MFKYFLISMFVTAMLVGLILQMPTVRRKLFAVMERLAEWHEKGT